MPGAAAAELGAHAGEQLAQRERLGDVVVRPEVEGADLVLLLAAHREDDHRRRGPTRRTAATPQAVRPRHGEVGDHQIGPALLESALPSTPSAAAIVS